MRIIRPSLRSYRDKIGMLDLYYSRNTLISIFFWGRFQKLLELVKWDKTQVTLEIGFGPGVLFPTLGNVSDAVIGVGPEGRKHLSTVHEMLKHEQIDLKTTLVRGDACRLPLRNEQFDVVIAADVLEHISNIDEVLGEIKRVLRTGAYLLVSAPIESRLRKALRRMLGYDLPIDYHTHLAIEGSIRALFHTVKIERYPSLLHGFLLIQAQK